MQLLDTNLVAAVNAMGRSGQGGRIVNVAARHALEWRSGAGMVAYTASKAAVAALTVDYTPSPRSGGPISRVPPGATPSMGRIVHAPSPQQIAV